MQPKLYVGRYLGHHARTDSILIKTTDGVVKAAKFRRMNDGMLTIGMLFVVSVEMSPKRGQKLHRLSKPHDLHLHVTPRRRYVTKADLRKYGATVGCSACSDTASHGKASKPHTEECRNGIGEQNGARS